MVPAACSSSAVETQSSSPVHEASEMRVKMPLRTSSDATMRVSIRRVPVGMSTVPAWLAGSSSASTAEAADIFFSRR